MLTYSNYTAELPLLSSRDLDVLHCVKSEILQCIRVDSVVNANKFTDFLKDFVVRHSYTDGYFSFCSLGLAPRFTLVSFLCCFIGKFCNIFTQSCSNK